MSDTPFFSVLIINYNGGTYLQKAIDSLAAQTFQNFETELTGGFAFGGGFRGRIGNSGLGWRVDYTRIDLDGKIADAYSGALTFNF